MLAVDRLTSLPQLEAVKSRWIELYRQDDRAHFFTSWEWLHACLTTESNPWMILGVRDGDGPYIGLLPLGDGRFPNFGPTLNRELYLGGIPRADLTGFLIQSGEEHRVIPALARYIQSIPWDNFTLNDWPDDRIAALIAEFPEIAYRATTDEPSPCPMIKLAPTWEEYMAGRSRHTRNVIKGKFRKIEAAGEVRFDIVPDSEMDEAIETLLDMNASRWKKSRRKREQMFGHLFRKCRANGSFIIGALKLDGVLIALQGSFIDTKTKTLLGYMMAYDPAYSQLSPGSVMVARFIRHAIENGFEYYDLSRGEETYKKSFASDTRYSNHVTLTRRTLRTAAVNAGRSGFFKAKAIARNLLRPSA
jgi:CelD/BcsL family acetyltransferase involved in cellulose biosynthesis